MDIVCHFKFRAGTSCAIISEHVLVYPFHTRDVGRSQNMILARLRTRRTPLVVLFDWFCREGTLEGGEIPVRAGQGCVRCHP